MARTGDRRRRRFGRAGRRRREKCRSSSPPNARRRLAGTRAGCTHRTQGSGTRQAGGKTREQATAGRDLRQAGAAQGGLRAKPAGRGGAKAGTGAAADRDGSADVARAQVIADAARLVQWGRKWYELPELIARMADRPSLPEVRRILKENKSAIDEKAGASSR